MWWEECVGVCLGGLYSRAVKCFLRNCFRLKMFCVEVKTVFGEIFFRGVSKRQHSFLREDQPNSSNSGFTHTFDTTQRVTLLPTLVFVASY